MCLWGNKTAHTKGKFRFVSFLTGESQLASPQAHIGLISNEKSMKEELFTPAFNAIFPTLDETIKNIHPDMRIRKIYALLRTKGFTQEDAKEYIEDLITNY